MAVYYDQDCHGGDVDGGNYLISTDTYVVVRVWEQSNAVTMFWLPVQVNTGRDGNGFSSEPTKIYRDDGTGMR